MKILDKMYEDQDSQSLQEQIKSVIEDRNQKAAQQDQKNPRKLTREEINQKIMNGH